MAITVNPEGGGGKKPVDAELNLVPFIDLLVCCICFLLITAVWTKMAQLPVQQGGPTGDVVTPEIAPPAQGRLTVLVGEEGYTLTDDAGARQVIPRHGAAYDLAGLGRALDALTRGAPRLRSLTLAVADGVRYRHLVDALGTARARSIPRVRVSDASLRL